MKVLVIVALGYDIYDEGKRSYGFATHVWEVEILTDPRGESVRRPGAGIRNAEDRANLQAIWEKKCPVRKLSHPPLLHCRMPRRLTHVSLHRSVLRASGIVNGILKALRCSSATEKAARRRITWSVRP